MAARIRKNKVAASPVEVFSGGPESPSDILKNAQAVFPIPGDVLPLLETKHQFSENNEEMRLAQVERQFDYEILALSLLEAKMGSAGGSYSERLLSSPAFEKERTKYLFEKDRLQRSTESIKGLIPCVKCGSLQTQTRELQIRSGDEPMTQFTKCLVCGFVSKK